MCEGVELWMCEGVELWKNGINGKVLKVLQYGFRPGAIQNKSQLCRVQNVSTTKAFISCYAFVVKTFCTHYVCTAGL